MHGLTRIVRSMTPRRSYLHPASQLQADVEAASSVMHAPNNAPLHSLHRVKQVGDLLAALYIDNRFRSINSDKRCIYV